MGTYYVTLKRPTAWARCHVQVEAESEEQAAALAEHVARREFHEDYPNRRTEWKAEFLHPQGDCKKPGYPVDTAVPDDINDHAAWLIASGWAVTVSPHYSSVDIKCERDKDTINQWGRTLADAFRAAHQEAQAIDARKLSHG